MTAAVERKLDRWTKWHFWGAVGMTALGVAATAKVWRDIYHIAAVDEEYSHIFLVPLVALWMVWVRRMRFRHCSGSGRMIGPAIVLMGWGMNTYGFYHGVQSFWHGGAVLIVVGCMLSVLGKNVIFRFFPAFLVLVFLVPVPGRIRQEIALPLQAWTAAIAQWMLEIIGVETVRSGNVLSINGKAVTVAEACNGLRMVFALILVVYAFCFSMPLRNSVRVLLLLASPLAAIGINVIRILPTVWLYGNASPHFAGEFHEYAGWCMMPVAFLMLLGMVKLMRWMMIPVERYTLAVDSRQ